jgi:transposase
MRCCTSPFSLAARSASRSRLASSAFAFSTSRLGMEATGHARWFERLLAELGFELWIGDPAEIKAKRVKKQKFDREDARLLLRLLLEEETIQRKRTSSVRETLLGFLGQQ